MPCDRTLAAAVRQELEFDASASVSLLDHFHKVMIMDHVAINDIDITYLICYFEFISWNYFIKGSLVEKLRVTDGFILNSPEIIKSSRPLALEIIKSSWHLALEIIKSRWHLAQEIIKSSWHVALEILKSSWHLP